MSTTHDTNQLIEKYKDIKRYKTSDIALASTMMVLKKKLLYIEPLKKTESPRGDIFHFIFEKDDDMDDIVLQYSTNSEDLTVMPNAFRSTMRYLKVMTKNYTK